MSKTWDSTAAGVLELPSGRLIRGRGLRYPLPEGPEPALGVYLLGKEPPVVPWESWWVRWPDFRLPSHPALASGLLHQAWERAARERVEIACGGGVGRTGTALACIAVIDGVPPEEAVAYVRGNYHRRAVETPWQKRYVARFVPPPAAETEPGAEPGPGDGDARDGDPADRGGRAAAGTSGADAAGDRGGSPARP
jgi:hypothetical protein